jgi:short-subunit dehydrogenase
MERSKDKITRKYRRFRLKYGEWAVVTGASDGIGSAMAMNLAERGLNLVLVARRKDRLDDLGSKLTYRYGIEARALSVDLNEERSIEIILKEAAELNVGLLVAAAGFGSSGDFLNSNLKNEIEMVNVNCRAVVTLTCQFGRRFATQRRGGIVLMSSLLAFQGVPKAANYAATKAYVQSLVEGLRP